MFYFAKTPGWLKMLFPGRTWDIKTTKKELYLSFDDGPHPEITSFVLDELKRYDAKASFFCIGKNVVASPEIYRRILDEGHAVGNHTFKHLNGWKVSNKEYLRDIQEASLYIDSKLYRPPYGRMTRFQQKLVENKMEVIMWSILSGDFDTSISPERCLSNVLLNIHPGAIIVFHDSEKAFPLLKEVLPKALKYLSERGYVFKALKETEGL
ncbi:MAG: polysaccharide deacetylase family protein [Ferruginibacter sp.]